jgi:hypothetical protein
MFKWSVTINEKTDLNDAVRQIQIKLDRSELADPARNLLLMASGELIREFAQRGSSLAESGSHFHAKRTLEGSDYSVKIEADFGSRQSLFTRIASILKR